MQPTSLIAYEKVKETLGKRQARFLLTLDYSPTAMTNTEMSRLLGWPINCITGRCKELRDKGLVKEHEKRKCKITGQNVIAWRLKRFDEIRECQMEMSLDNV